VRGNPPDRRDVELSVVETGWHPLRTPFLRSLVCHPARSGVNFHVSRPQLGPRMAVSKSTSSSISRATNNRLVEVQLRVCKPGLKINIELYISNNLPRTSPLLLGCSALGPVWLPPDRLGQPFRRLGAASPRVEDLWRSSLGFGVHLAHSRVGSPGVLPQLLEDGSRRSCGGTPLGRGWGGDNRPGIVETWS
jgi:hypothetical protein